jgi:hypothetical protein
VKTSLDSCFAFALIGSVSGCALYELFSGEPERVEDGFALLLQLPISLFFGWLTFLYLERRRLRRESRKSWEDILRMNRQFLSIGSGGIESGTLESGTIQSSHIANGGITRKQEEKP